MARNINQIKQTNGFIATSPQIATQWSNPKMAKTKAGTGDVGKIIPVFFRSMTPGEKFKMKQSANIQFTPFMSNLFQQIDGELVTYFCPDRISTFKKYVNTNTSPNGSLTDNAYAISGNDQNMYGSWETLWKNFITGGETGEPILAANTLPRLNLKTLYNNTPAQDENGNHLVQTLADYFQMKIKDFDETYDNPVNKRLWHAYNTIYNECLRNPDFTQQRLSDDNTVATAYWESDRFTHARKQQMRGTVPSVPLSDQYGRVFEMAHEVTASNNPMDQGYTYVNTDDNPIIVTKAEDSGQTKDKNFKISTRAGSTQDPELLLMGENKFSIANHSLSNIGINLNDLLTNLAIMKYETNNERMLPFYEDQLYYRFGIEKQDVRLNKPEMVYRQNIGIGIETVTQTSAGGDASSSGTQSYQGNITSQGWGHGEGSGEYEIKEHGILMTLMIIRPKGVYENGVERPWWGDIDRYDFITPELVDIPDVAIENQELYYTGNKAKDKKTFGYQAIYDEYRTMTNEVCGWLRPSVIGGLPTYTLARALDENVELNDSFLKCNPEMNRIKQFTGDNVPDFLFFVRTELWMAQPLPLINNPTTIM